MSAKAFSAMIQSVGGGVMGVGRVLSERLGVPFTTTRERRLGYRLRETPLPVGSLRGGSEGNTLREGEVLLEAAQYRLPDGRILTTGEIPIGVVGIQQLTEEVWSRDHTPDVFHDVLGAMGELVHGVTSIYFHTSSMCLVLVSVTGEKVGIRSLAIVTPFGLHGDVRHLERLKRAASC